MRRSTLDGYPDRYAKYTRIFLPNPGESATEGVGLQGDAARTEAFETREDVNVPLMNEARRDPSVADAQLRDSAYAQVYDLALEWTAGEETPYDAVKAIENRLQEEYRYAERVPTREIPLHGFLFQERAGYCQQFSGAMALMLRMIGVPARVAAERSQAGAGGQLGEDDGPSWLLRLLALLVLAALAVAGASTVLRIRAQ